jgi:5'-nucleotidase
VLESAARWGIAHLLAIHHPDSAKAPVVSEHFPGIHHFNELAPGQQEYDTQ